MYKLECLAVSSLVVPLVMMKVADAPHDNVNSLICGFLYTLYVVAACFFVKVIRIKMSLEFTL